MEVGKIKKYSLYNPRDIAKISSTLSHLQKQGEY